MENVPEAALDRGEARHKIEVADETLAFRAVWIEDLTPTGFQLSAAAGFKPAQQATVLHILHEGELEDVRPSEAVDLRNSEGRFVIVESDRSYRLTIDGERFDWPCRIVSGGLLRKLGRVRPDEKAIYLERSDEPDRLIGNHDLVDLDAPGIESFVSRKLAWKLNVQGVILDVATPTIVVGDALTRAGFDPNQGWHIFLKIEGEPKRAVGLTDTIDLRTRGIEKLRLTPKEVNNGEAPSAPRRDFALLEIDETHLDDLGPRWETVMDAGRRWLLIHQFPVPVGFTTTWTQLALEIPPTYPGAQIDMFYTYPPLTLASGRVIECTHVSATIVGVPFNGWSRHRGPESPWNPSTDNVVTHLALVESALAKEVGE